MGTRTKRQKEQRNKANWSFETLEPRLVMAVLINEFLAANTAGLQDVDGDRSDWIELRNTDVAAVNVAGWHLTDDATNLTKWTLPSTSIPAGGYLLVWASGKDRAVAGQQLHANFSLDQAGEYLGLVMPDGVTVADAYAPFPAQVNDISYGRGASSTVTDGLIGDFGQLKVLVPTTSAVDVSGVNPWTAVGFNDSSWTTGISGVGYDNNGGTVDYASYVNTSTLAQMNNATRASAYIRMPFSMSNLGDYTSLKLRMRYDDGFAVYLNGTEITAARRNFAAAPAALTFQSAASASHADASAIIYEDIDLTPYKNLLIAGNNVLAIHGLNRTNNATAYGDFLIDARLEANRNVAGITGYMSTPTPGAVNQSGTLGVVADTNFSVHRGFFSAPFNVQITTTTPGAVIRYTTNGSEPTDTTGTIYNPASPPLITTTTTLRAAAFKTGWTPASTDTQTYIFATDVVHQNGSTVPAGLTPWGGSLANPVPDWSMDTDIVDNPAYSGQIVNALKSIPTVSLVAPWTSWFGPASVGIYPTQSELEVGTSMEYFSADGSEQFHITGSIEVQGGTSDDRWKTDKLSMRVHFKEPYGPEKLDADPFHNGAIDEGAAQTFNTLYLDAQINYSWPYGGSSGAFAGADQRLRAKYIQDQYVSDLQNLAGGAAPHGRFVQLYINGMYWGMYDMHERPDEHFAESYLGGNNDDYDVLKHTATTVVASDVNNPNSAIDNYAALLALVRAADMATNPASYAAVAAKLDIDDFIDYMVINDYVGNDDWAHHNWYATYNRVDPNGKWRFHSWDAEHVLKDINRDSTTLNNAGAPTEILQELAAAPEFRLRFADRVQKLFYNGGLLSPTGAAAAYQTRMNEVNLAIITESARWGDSRTNSNDVAGGGPSPGQAYTQANWQATQANLMTSYFPSRTGIVQSQFNARGWNVALAAPTFSQYGGTVMSGYGLTVAKPGGSPAAAKIYYTLDGSDPRDPATNLLRAGVLEYTGSPIVINAGKQVNARIYLDAAGSFVDEWSPIIETTFLLQTPFPIRITELNYNPAPLPSVTSDAQDLEFIELMNTGAQSISLDGVSIANFATNPYVFPGGINLAAGERIIVARTPATFTAAYGAGYNVASTGYANANLSNGGERVTLLGPVGETLQDFTYADSAPWPTAPDGAGKSLEIIDPLGDSTAGTNWRGSFYSGGSPGSAGLAPAAPGDADVDGDVDGADFLAFQQGLGTPALKGKTALGDADGDRDVDAADLNVLKTNWGTVPMEAVAVVADSTSSLVAAPIVVTSNVAAVLKDDEWILVDPPAHAKVGAANPEHAQIVDDAFAALHRAGAARVWPALADHAPSRRAASLAHARHDAADESLADDGAADALACDLAHAAL